MYYLTSSLTSSTIRKLASNRIGWMMVPPRNWARITDFPTEVWGVDNNCFKYGEQWSWDTFSGWLTKSPHNAGCKFVTAPDVMADARATLLRSSTFFSMIRDLGFPAALVAQDGCTSSLVPWDDIDCLFIGGTTEWKLSQYSFELCHEAKQRGKWVHVGRVNSLKRVLWAKQALADSVDGTHLAYTKPEFVQTIDSWLRHSDLLQSRLI